MQAKKKTLTPLPGLPFPFPLSRFGHHARVINCVLAAAARNQASPSTTVLLCREPCGSANHRLGRMPIRATGGLSLTTVTSLHTSVAHFNVLTHPAPCPLMQAFFFNAGRIPSAQDDVPSRAHSPESFPPLGHRPVSTGLGEWLAVLFHTARHLKRPA